MDELIQKQLGQYKLTEIIRRGGMSTVYKAYQPSLDRYVAVKVLLYNRDPQFAARFKREARAIAQMQHPNILPIYDYGEQEGLLYLVLQYIENGLTLGDLLGQSMAPTQALRLTGHLLGALEYAHKRGVIHRDIKPANVLMPSMTWPMLADFGIAKLMNDGQQNLTSPGLIVGTAAYMAPEQATSSGIDARTDIYATGVVLYEMVTGRVPFDADTPMAMLTKHAYEAPPPPRLLKPDVSPLVEAVLLRALAKDPNARYQSAGEMAQELERVVSLLEQPKAHGQLTNLYQTGLHAFEEGRWDQAVERLGELVTLNPHFQDADDLLEAAREAQERAKTEAKHIAAGAQARGLMRKGKEKQQAGNLRDALNDYRAALAVAPPGALHQDLTALIAEVSARIEQAKPPAGQPRCPQCERPVQPEWSGCPYCRTPLGTPLAETQPGAPLSVKGKPAGEPAVQPLPTLIASTPATAPEIKPALSRDVAPPKPPRIGRRWQIGGALAIALALMIGGGRAILGMSQPNGTRTSPTTANSAVVVAATTAAPAATSTPSPSPTSTSAPTNTPTSVPTATPPPTATPEPATATAAPPTAPPEPQAVTTQNLKLRAGPGEAFAIISTYSQGSTFQIIGKEASGAWLNVAAQDGKVGWMAAAYLSLNVDAATLAVVDAPQAPTARSTARPQPTARPQAPTARPQQPTQPPSTAQPQIPTPEPPPPTPEPPTPEPDPPTSEPDPPTSEPDPPTSEPDPPTSEPDPPTPEPKPTKTPRP